jgi:DNA-binding MarR family transcriptional regulator
VVPSSQTPEAPGGGRCAGASLESGLGFQLGRLHRVLREAWGEEIADLKLSPPQAAVLRAVCEWPGSGLRELARRMGADAMNAKRLADNLENLDLVRSAADPAHRQRRVLLPTEEGAALAGEINRRAEVWDRRLSELIGAEELRGLNRLLARLEERLESQTSSSGHGPGGPAPAGAP